MVEKVALIQLTDDPRGPTVMVPEAHVEDALEGLRREGHIALGQPVKVRVFGSIREAMEAVGTVADA